MKPKPLWRVCITTTPEAEDAVADMLGATLGCGAASYLDVESGRSTVTVYCNAKPAAGERATILAGLEQIRKCGLKPGFGRLTIAPLRREDWAESWKRHFKPIEINPRRIDLPESLNKTILGTRLVHSPIKSLLIKPSWSKQRPQKSQAVVVLDPGLSFGTGQHPTTSFCLGEIVRCSNMTVDVAQRHRRLQTKNATTTKSLLDIGTGSGILAIAAAKLGFRPIEAFDFDGDAVEIARVNARKNRVAEKIHFRRADVAKLPSRPARRFDLICANLISDLLISERRLIAAQLQFGGTLVLAGILKREFGEVRAAFENLGLKLVSDKAEKEWQSGAFRQMQIF
jgi:ribosomal protein L11 methyltransferase